MTAPHAVVQDFPASWQAFTEALALLDSRMLGGLLLLAAGPTDEGIRAISLWKSQSDWNRFRDERLPTLLQDVEPARAIQTTSRQLVVEHLFVFPIPPQS